MARCLDKELFLREQIWTFVKIEPGLFSVPVNRTVMFNDDLLQICKNLSMINACT